MEGEFSRVKWGRGVIWYIEPSSPIEIWQPRAGAEYTVRTSRGEEVIAGPFPTLEGAKAAYVLLEAAR